MGITQNEIKERVRIYIIQSVYVDKEKVNDSTLIFKEGFLDSMGLMGLITFLEEEFKIKTTDSDLLEENFESVNAITEFVLGKSPK